MMHSLVELVAQPGPARESPAIQPAAATRAIYIGQGPNRTFASVHLPDHGCTRLQGVVFCPPLSWEEECTYRTRRNWAEQVARAGYPAIRFDLPGIGDSAGTSRSPGRLDAWLEATAAAAAWLRAEAGCTRIAGLGIGFGGMLAWLSAARGAPIDDLILWAVPLRGRQFVREIRAAAMLNIQRDVRLPPEPEPASSEASFELQDGELLDEAGQVMTRETSQELSGIDLRTTPLSSPEERRVLLFHRTGNTADDALRDHLRQSGVKVTAAAGHEFGEMMQYVQESVAPKSAIRASLSWLAECERSLPETRSQRVVAFPPAVESAEHLDLVHDGVTIRERPVTIELTTGSMFGIVSEPVGIPSAGITAVFFSGGSDRRIGPNRLWVELARSWAARGLATARFDLGGIGDSDGDEHRWDRVNSHYAPWNLGRSLEQLDALERLGLPNRFVITGFCSGSHRAFHAAVNDRRVVGVFAIALPFFRWNWLTVNLQANHGWLLHWRPGTGESRAKALTIRVLRNGLRGLLWCRRVKLNLSQRRSGDADRLIEQVTAQETELLVVVRPDSYAHELLTRPRRAPRLSANPRLRIHEMPSDDSRFRPLRVRKWLREILDDSLTRVLNAHAVDLRENGSETPCAELEDPERIPHLRLISTGNGPG